MMLPIDPRPPQGSESTLRVYDPKHKELKTCHLPSGLPRAYWLWTSTIYVETLVSIKELQRR